MSFLPICLKIAHAKIAVIGGGKGRVGKELSQTIPQDEVSEIICYH